MFYILKNRIKHQIILNCISVKLIYEIAFEEFL